MAEPSKQIIFDGAEHPEYDLLRDIVSGTGGWMRSSGGEFGESITTAYNDTEYIFRGRAVIDFLYAKKNFANKGLEAALALIAYIEDSAKQPPSKFTRDAIVLKARETQAVIREAGD